MVGENRDALAADLARVRKQFVAWRRNKKPRERIPATLWKLAVRLAGKHGLNRTASMLKLDYYALKKRVEQARENPFVEVVATSPLAGGECVIELEDGAGGSLRVTLKGHALPDLAALARDFWNAD